MMNSRFAKGSGVYTCRSCSSKTRSTGRGDNENALLCVACFELAGFYNMVLDGVAPSEAEIECARAYARTYDERGVPNPYPDLVGDMIMLAKEV